MAGAAKKDDKTVQVRTAPSKKKGTPAVTPTVPPSTPLPCSLPYHQTTPTPKKKAGGKATTPDIDVSKDSTTQTGGVDRTADVSMKGGKKKSPKKKSSGRIDKIVGKLFHQKKNGGRTTRRSSKKEVAKAGTAETVQSENSQTKGSKMVDEKTKNVKSRGKGKGDNQEKASNMRKREKPSAKKGGGAQTPKKEGDSMEHSKEAPSMDVDDEGESKLIPTDGIAAKGGGKKKVPASTPQAEVEKKEREGKGKEKTMVTARKKSSVAAITMYDAGNDKAFARLACLRELEHRGWTACEEDFRSNHKMNPEVNRDTRYVISFNVPPDGDFYDANKVDIPGVDNKFIVAAAPTTEISSRENFWRMVYDSSVANIFYVEDFKASGAHFVPWKAGEARDYGKMFVSNKKMTTSKNEGTQSVLEVLPEGCSNSIIVRFVQCHKWPEKLHRDGKKFSELNHPVVFARLLKDDKGLTMVVCSSGCGKSAMFIMLHAAITALNTTRPIPIHDLLQKVRHDRWGAIQTMEQYLTLYQLYIYYIAAKSKPKSDVNELCRELIKTLINYPIKK
ncbi:hypothetical protein PENTCL1PPCAC_6230 [Pristionchus entomophagus]|uniref:Tyrosine phosphatase n=1 Tax=Pristionchus entomophagus TaxID=358040 RepID=A0AAV5SNC5_9BILA|nr:hypothetical protein PENTCL1PPCAC_6230 [Pristionchus entomophagus]